MSENPNRSGPENSGYDATFSSGSHDYEGNWRDPYGEERAYGSTPRWNDGGWNDPYASRDGGGPGGYGNPYRGDPGPGYSAGYSTRLSPDSERTWAMLAHAAAPIAMVLSVGSLSILGPLLVWALYKDQSTYVRRAAAAAFNFNVILWVMSIVGFALLFTIILAPVGGLLILLSLIGTFLFHILAAIDASRGRLYRYPAGIPLLS